MTVSFDQVPERCPKCGGRLLGEVLAGRQVNGAVRSTRIVGLSCLCGYWRDVDAPAVSREMPADEMKPNKAQQYYGGRKPGNEISPASVVAVECFDLIAKYRRSQLSWLKINDALMLLSGKQFCDRSLKRYYDAEVLRRREERAVKQRAILKAARAARRVKEVAV